MGKKKHLQKIWELFEKSPVVDAGSIKRIISNKKRVKQYHKQLIRNLLKQNRIYRITKGYYTVYDEPSLAVFCFKPSYLGLQDALSVHNLWEQETIPIIITTKKIRAGIRKVFGVNVMIRRIDKKYFFGFDYIKQGDFYFPYSDVEKTFIDLLYFKQNLDREVMRNIKKKIDIKKLNKYLKKYPKEFRKRVLKRLR